MFDYKVDVKTPRGVSVFLPETPLGNDPGDGVIVMAWHRGNEDSLILLDRRRTGTLRSKAASQEKYLGEAPEKLDHPAAWPMNGLIDLGPNMAYMNQKPENLFSPGDRVKKRGDKDTSVVIVVEVLSPEQNTGVYGVEMEGEVVNVTFPSSLDEGPRNWKTIHPALYASYRYDQSIQLYTYKYSNLGFAKDE